MNLLIIAQNVDRKDPVMGFFHPWIEEFSKHVDSLTVIGQATGMYHFDDHVKVHSLGKEYGRSRPLQILRFWWLILRLHREYDAVLVHMSPIWIPLGAPIWLLLRKRMYLWYEVRRGGWSLRLALKFVRRVFSATPSGLPRPSRKQLVVGHGIDTEQFKPDEKKRDAHLVSTVGRITRIKHLPEILSAFAELPKEYHFTLAGGTVTHEDTVILAELRHWVRAHEIEKRMEIHPLRHEQVATLLRETNIFLHAAGGGLDKVVLEAMASGCLVASSCRAADHVLPRQCQATHESLAATAKKLLALSVSEQKELRAKLRAIVEKGHSLPKLVERLVREMTLR